MLGARRAPTGLLPLAGEPLKDVTTTMPDGVLRMCHPPHGVHIVEQIMSDYRAGRASRTDFWIAVGERFVHIEYVALRDPQGAYLGCLEATQDLTAKRALKGEQRLLSYGR